MGTVPFSIRLDEGIKRDLEKVAKLEDRSASWLAANAIKIMLDAKAKKRKLLEAAIVEADKGEFISSDSMTNWFESIGTDHELPEPEPEMIVKSGNS